MDAFCVQELNLSNNSDASADSCEKTSCLLGKRMIFHENVSRAESAHLKSYTYCELEEHI